MQNQMMSSAAGLKIGMAICIHLPQHCGWLKTVLHHPVTSWCNDIHSTFSYGNLFLDIQHHSFMIDS